MLPVITPTGAACTGSTDMSVPQIQRLTNRLWYEDCDILNCSGWIDVNRLETE
jgi:hypothetical protein